MNEKDIVNDYLSMMKGSLTGYASIITETSNPELRQTLQQLRDQDEQRQQKVAQMAIQKGYYKPASQASKEDVTTVKNEFSQTY